MTEKHHPAPRCAVCGKPQDQKYRPFCCKRCADVDLNRWLSGGYVIAGNPEEGLSSDQPAPPEQRE